MEKRIPEQAPELYITEDEIIKNVMLKDTAVPKSYKSRGCRRSRNN